MFELDKMKKLIYSIVLVFSLSICAAQDSLYVIDSKPYLEIENGISVNEAIPWGQFSHDFRIPIGFTFEFLGKKFDSVSIESSGRLIFDNDHYFFADAFTEISLQDIGYEKGQSLSPISYKNEDIGSGKVLIIQFKNAGFENDNLSVINFQIRLYENNEFELHMGPSKINNYSTTFINGPYCVIQKIAEFDNPNMIGYQLAVYGNSENPNIASNSGNNLDPFAYKLSTMPPLGTIYRLKTILPNKK